MIVEQDLFIEKGGSAHMHYESYRVASYILPKTEVMVIRDKGLKISLFLVYEKRTFNLVSKIEHDQSTYPSTSQKQYRS